MPSVLWRCWLGGRKGIWHWLVQMEWHPAGWSMCLPLLIFPCTIKSRSSVLAPAHLGGRGKRAVKRSWWMWSLMWMERMSYWFSERYDSRILIVVWLSSKVSSSVVSFARLLLEHFYSVITVCEWQCKITTRRIELIIWIWNEYFCCAIYRNWMDCCWIMHSTYLPRQYVYVEPINCQVSVHILMDIWHEHAALRPHFSYLSYFLF